MKKKKKKKTEFFPRRRRYIFHLRDSIRYFLPPPPLSHPPPLSPLLLFPWKTQFLASVKSGENHRKCARPIDLFPRIFQDYESPRSKSPGIFMAWRTIHQVIKPDESFSFNIEHYPRTQIKIVVRWILKL